MDARKKSALTGLLTIADPQAGEIDTPFGKVQFVEFVGASDKELLMLENDKLSPEELFRAIGSDITDYDRKSVF